MRVKIKTTMGFIPYAGRTSEIFRIKDDPNETHPIVVRFLIPGPEKLENWISYRRDEVEFIQ